MGCWGMGITQSDEYCDVYERFMEAYGEGKPVADITKDILEEYLDEFEPDDGVLHDVYFALGKAEWMCGGITDAIFKRISGIIENEENINFYRELEATEKDLKLRRKNLEKFLCSLSNPRGKTRKRRISEEKYISEQSKYAPLPDVHGGDVFAYENSGKYRIFAVIERENISLCPMVLCYAWRKTFDQIPTMDELRREDVLPIGWFNGETFPDLKKLTFIENFPLLKRINYVLSKWIYVWWDWRTGIRINDELLDGEMLDEEKLFKEYPLSLYMALDSVFDKINQINETHNRNYQGEEDEN